MVHYCLSKYEFDGSTVMTCHPEGCACCGGFFAFRRRFIRALRKGDELVMRSEAKQDWILALSDQQLAERFSEYWINSTYADLVQLRVFTNIDTLRHYSKLKPDTTVFLVDSSWRELLDYEGHPLFPEAVKVIVSEQEPKDECEISIYQPLSQLFEVVWNRGSHDTLDDSHINAPLSNRNSSFKVVSVCSAGGGSGKTMAAFQLARYAAANGLRVFYWNLGFYPEWMLLYTDATELPRASNSFSQLMYYLRNDNSLKRDIPVDSFTIHVAPLRADTFDPSSKHEEWKELSERELGAVVKWLEGTGRYDLVLIDTADGSPCLDDVLHLSNDIVWLILDDLPHLSKTVQCWNRIRQEHRDSYSTICARTHLLVNRYLGSMHNRWWRPELPLRGYLPYIPHWKQFHRVEQWFGSAVFQTAFEEWAATSLPWLGSNRQYHVV